MRIYKLDNENLDNLDPTVLEGAASSERTFGFSHTRFSKGLAHRMKQAKQIQKEATHRKGHGIEYLGWFVTALLIMTILSQPGMATAGQASDQLMQSVQKIQAILSDPSLKGEAKTQERRQKLREAIKVRFDFDEMAKRSLGPEWQKHDLEEQKEFVRSFTALVEGVYFDRLESYNGEKVRWLNERQDKDFAEVSTKVTNNKNEEFSVNYRLRDVSGDWKVFDFVIENVSLVNNFRSQFNRVLAKSSYAELVKTINQKKISAPSGKN